MAALSSFFSVLSCLCQETYINRPGWKSYIICVQQELHIAAICIQQHIFMMVFSSPVFLFMSISYFLYLSRFSYQVNMDYNTSLSGCQHIFLTAQP